MASCFLSSRAMPWLSGRSEALQDSGEFLTLPGERLLGFRQLGLARSLEHLSLSELMRFQSGHLS